MSEFAFDRSFFTMAGAFYPKGHVFAMFSSESAVRDAAERVATIPGIGAVSVVSPKDIVHAFGARAAEVGGMPSVGREDQFMLRFVELANDDEPGLLIEVSKADVDAISQVLESSGAWLAYHYRALVIDELVDTKPGAEAAAAGRL